MSHKLATYDIAELKAVYRVLHANLMDNLELMDSAFLQELQDWLQLVAGQQGVDIGDHAQWDAWLGNQAVACEERVARRLKLVR